MGRAFMLILLAFAATACFAAGSDNTPPKKPKKTSSTTSTVRKTSSRAVARKPAATGTSRVKYVRGRNGKLVRVRTHVAPAPSYQLHPDPERYQQIQQALADKGYFKGEVNGQWGDDSVDALKRFQADQKLDSDGHLNALSLIGLGLGPKHDGDVSIPTPAAPTNLPGNPALKIGPSLMYVPIASSTQPPTLGASPDR